jgi:hypothetical protein
MRSMTDSAILTFYRVEYFREWNLARKNGIILTANDIRVRLGIA